MDRREAIEWLKSIRRTSVFEQVEALDLAIEALGDAESATTTDCISRKQAVEEIALHDCTNGEVPYFTGKGVQEILNTLPPVTPTNNIQQADTLIIAAALRDFAQDSERNISDGERAEELRERVLAYGASMCYDTPTEDREVSTIDIDRPQGEWIPKEFPYAWYYPKCSICGFENEGELNNYCPNCGARMVGDKDEK